MLPYLLNILYLAAAVVASPWLVYQAVSKGKYREGFAAKLLGMVPRRNSGRPCIWLHAVSVGEVNLLAPLICELEHRFPNSECVVSTTTTTGYALARKKYGAERVFYAPLDFTWAVKRAICRVRPSMLVLAELEVWPNLIQAAKSRGAQVAIINGRLSERSFRGYRRLGRFIARVLAQIDLIAAQTPEYAERFRALGADPTSVCVTGSIKYDGAQTDRNNLATQRLARLAGFEEGDVVFLAGSTQEPEEAAALEAYQSLCVQFPQLRLVLVPRHPDRFQSVARLLDQSGLRWQRRSELEWLAEIRPAAVGSTALQCRGREQGAEAPYYEQGRAGEQGAEALYYERASVAPQPSREPDHLPRVLLVDAMGELGAWWGTAHIAFVGGSLGSRGGQNMIEPAAYGAAVCFGPNTRNFRDIVAALLDARAAEVVRNTTELAAFVRRALENPEQAREMGERAAALVKRHQGATARTVDLLEPFLADELVMEPCKHAA